MCECKELIGKGVCDKGFIWNPSNCKCKCYKFCDFIEYLDYKNIKCKKKLVDKLVEQSSTEECTENIDETRLVEINLTKLNSVKKKCKHNSCTLYIVLLLILFTINIGINSYFVYSCWYLKMLFVLTT